MSEEALVALGAARTRSAPKIVVASSEGSCRSAGTLVRQSRAAAKNQTTAAPAKVATLPMRVAVISDVHGNYHALETVLDEIDAEGVDAVWCLGDTVGYGPLPNECCEAVEERARRRPRRQPRPRRPRRADRKRLQRRSRRGRSLDVASSLTYRSRGVSRAPQAVGRTGRRRPLPRERARPGLGVRPDGGGGARDARPLGRATRPRRPQPRSARAHPGGRGGGRRGRPGRNRGRARAAAGCSIRAPSASPATPIPRAAWLLLDLDRRFAAFRRVQYPIQETQAEMRERGLPGPLAARLARGD